MQQLQSEEMLGVGDVQIDLLSAGLPQTFDSWLLGTRAPTMPAQAQTQSIFCDRLLQQEEKNFSKHLGIRSLVRSIRILRASQLRAVQSPCGRGFAEEL